MKYRGTLNLSFGQGAAMGILGEDKIYNEREAAALLGMSERMLAQRRRAGKICHIKDGDYIAYLQSHLDDFCKRSEKGAPSEKVAKSNARITSPPLPARRRSRKLKTHRKAPDAGERFTDLISRPEPANELPSVARQTISSEDSS
jgi:hypothetical protein